ncbi:unnamed protein product [Amoebophrya sp. A120]|nr:unnamed protein product [Amoebophrya sp. A120]|eukprot:GSA120T00019133001.1
MKLKDTVSSRPWKMRAVFVLVFGYLQFDSSCHAWAAVLVPAQSSDSEVRNRKRSGSLTRLGEDVTPRDSRYNANSPEQAGGTSGMAGWATAADPKMPVLPTDGGTGSASSSIPAARAAGSTYAFADAASPVSPPYPTPTDQKPRPVPALKVLPGDINKKSKCPVTRLCSALGTARGVCAVLYRLFCLSVAYVPGKVISRVTGNPKSILRPWPLRTLADTVKGFPFGLDLQVEMSRQDYETIVAELGHDVKRQAEIAAAASFSQELDLTKAGEATLRVDFPIPEVVDSREDIYSGLYDDRSGTRQIWINREKPELQLVRKFFGAGYELFHYPTVEQIAAEGEDAVPHDSNTEANQRVIIRAPQVEHVATYDTQNGVWNVKKIFEGSPKGASSTPIKWSAGVRPAHVCRAAQEGAEGSSCHKQVVRIGPEYPEIQRLFVWELMKRATIAVPNHVSQLDPLLLMCVGWSQDEKTRQVQGPRFISHHGVKDYPIFGSVCSELNGIFVDRNSPESKKKCSEAIRNHCADWVYNANVGLSEDQRPLVIFAEGGLSNGKSLMPLRSGAFLDAQAKVRLVLLHFEKPGLAEVLYYAPKDAPLPAEPDSADVPAWDGGRVVVRKAADVSRVDEEEIVPSDDPDVSAESGMDHTGAQGGDGVAKPIDHEDALARRLRNNLLKGRQVYDNPEELQRVGTGEWFNQRVLRELPRSGRRVVVLKFLPLQQPERGESSLAFQQRVEHLMKTQYAELSERQDRDGKSSSSDAGDVTLKKKGKA